MTVAQALACAKDFGLDHLDAHLLLLHALGKPAADRAWLMAHDLDTLSDTAAIAFDALVQRRVQGEPVAYLTGRKEFFGLDLVVDARVLVPRPDTETLVEWALTVLDSLTARAERATRTVRAVRALDLGTGSGAVALAIRHFRAAVQVHATDVSADALVVAQANAQRLGLNVQFHQGAWLDGLQGDPDISGGQHRFDLIVSNPPYIAAQDPHLAALTHEPLQALASGPDGLDDIRTIISQAPHWLQRDGWLLLEHGYDQAARVRDLLYQAGFDEVQSRQDLAGIERCSGGCWPGAGT